MKQERVDRVWWPLLQGNDASGNLWKKKVLRLTTPPDPMGTDSNHKANQSCLLTSSIRTFLEVTKPNNGIGLLGAT